MKGVPLPRRAVKVGSNEIRCIITKYGINPHGVLPEKVFLKNVRCEWDRLLVLKALQRAAARSEAIEFFPVEIVGGTIAGSTALFPISRVDVVSPAEERLI